MSSAAFTVDDGSSSPRRPTGFRQIAGARTGERSDPAGDPDPTRRLRAFAVRETGTVPTV